MSCSELILKWAELLLQWQVLAFVLGLTIFIYLREEIRSIMQVIEKRGVKFSAGGVTGEIAASKDDNIDLKAIEVPAQQPDTPKKDIEVSKFISLTEKFSFIKKNGALARSNFVREIKRDTQDVFDWSFLKEKLSSSKKSERFIASSLLTNTLYEIDPLFLLNHLIHETSSLVRYRLIETLILWQRTSQSTEQQLSSILLIIDRHEDENEYVAELINKLKREILRTQYQ